MARTSEQIFDIMKNNNINDMENNDINDMENNDIKYLFAIAIGECLEMDEILKIDEIIKFLLNNEDQLI